MTKTTLTPVTACPQWPLRPDWLHAGGPTPPRPHPRNPHPQVQCKYCTQWLSINPQDHDSLRRHANSLKCAKGTEVVKMNLEGYHRVLLPAGLKEELETFAVKKLFYTYYPAPIVSYIRTYSTLYSTHTLQQMVKDFCTLSTDAQIAHLEGLILEYEFAQERNMT